jgi:hypothetical protein
MLLFAFILGQSTLNAQKFQDFEDEQVGYEFKTDVIIYEYDMKGGKVILEKKVIAKYGTLFYLIPGLKTDSTPPKKGGIGEYYAIKIAPLANVNETAITVDDNNVVQTKDAVTSKGSEVFDYAEYFTRTYIYGAKVGISDSKSGESAIYRKYFCLKASDLSEEKVRKKYKRMRALLSVGSMVLPVKIRPSVKREGTTRVPFDFSTDVTLGTTAGIRLRMSKYQRNYVNFLGGIGITTVLVDSTSTKGIIRESNSRAGAFTITIGALLEFDSFQFGVFTGLDYVGRSLSIDGKSAWDYQGKPWLAIGLGYQILSRNDEKK